MTVAGGGEGGGGEAGSGEAGGGEAGGGEAGGGDTAVCRQADSGRDDDAETDAVRVWL